MLLRVLGGSLLVVSVGFGYLTRTIFTFYESTHGSSVFRLSMGRFRYAVKDDPTLVEAARQLTHDVFLAYEWLLGCTLALGFATILLFGLGVSALVVATRMHG